MNLKHVLLFFALFLFPFVGCKKESVIGTYTDSTETDPGTGGGTASFNSGDFCYVPNVLNDDVNEVKQAFVQKEVVIPNYTAIIEEAYGTILWDAYEELLEYDSNGAYLAKGTIIPMVNPGVKHINALMVIFEPEGQEKSIFLFDRKDMKAVINSPVAVPEAVDFATDVFRVFSMDEKVFCQPDAEFGAGVEDRGCNPPCWIEWDPDCCCPGDFDGECIPGIGVIRAIYHFFAGNDGGGGGVGWTGFYGGSANGGISSANGGTIPDPQVWAGEPDGGSSTNSYEQDCGSPTTVSFANLDGALFELMGFNIGTLYGEGGLATLWDIMQPGCSDLEGEAFEDCVHASLVCAVAELLGGSVANETYACIQGLSSIELLNIKMYFDDHPSTNFNEAASLICLGIPFDEVEESLENANCSGGNESHYECLLKDIIEKKIGTIPECADLDLISSSINRANYRQLIMAQLNALPEITAHISDNANPANPNTYFNLYGYSGVTQMVDGEWVHSRWNHYYQDEEQMVYRNGAWQPYYPPPTAEFHLISEVVNAFVETGHFALDCAGMIPVVGEVADGINAVWYFAEGDIENGTLSSMAMIPFVGNFVTPAKWTRNAMKWIKVGGVEFFQSPLGLKYLKSATQDRMGHVLEHAVNKTSKPKHGVFDDKNDIFGIIDEAWQKKIDNNIGYTVDPNSGNWNYVIDLEKRVGWEGGYNGAGQWVDAEKILIAVKPNTIEVVTAFPKL